MMQFMIGSDVTCSDGGRGELTRVVVDPVARALTHLVVAPRHRPAADRLVPVGLVASASEVIQLRRTAAEFDDLERANETEFLPGEIAFIGGLSPSNLTHGWANPIGKGDFGPYYTLALAAGAGGRAPSCWWMLSSPPVEQT